MWFPRCIARLQAKVPGLAMDPGPGGGALWTSAVGRGGVASTSWRGTVPSQRARKSNERWLPPPWPQGPRQSRYAYCGQWRYFFLTIINWLNWDTFGVWCFPIQYFNLKKIEFEMLCRPSLQSQCTTSSSSSSTSSFNASASLDLRPADSADPAEACPAARPQDWGGPQEASLVLAARPRPRQEVGITQENAASAAAKQQHHCQAPVDHQQAPL